MHTHSIAELISGGEAKAPDLPFCPSGRKSYGFDLITMAEVRELGIEQVIARIRKKAGDARVFVTFDIDAVDPAFAPGTGTPEVGGFTSGEALNLVRGLNGLNIVGVDIVEVLPEYDPADVTALLAANIVYQFISIIAVKKSRNQKE